jgi:hypothetical protein
MGEAMNKVIQFYEGGFAFFLTPAILWMGLRPLLK